MRSQRRPSVNLSPPKPPAAAPTASSAPAERLASADYRICQAKLLHKRRCGSSAASTGAYHNRGSNRSEQTELSGTGAPR